VTARRLTDEALKRCWGRLKLQHLERRRSTSGRLFELWERPGQILSPRPSPLIGAAKIPIGNNPAFISAWPNSQAFSFWLMAVTNVPPSTSKRTNSSWTAYSRRRFRALTHPVQRRYILIIMNETKYPRTPGRTRSPDLILHPVRMRVILALASGVPMAVAEIHERMPDVPLATLYRHLKGLREGGIVAVADMQPISSTEKRTRGAIEHRFVLQSGAGFLGPGDLSGATADDHVRWFASFVASLLGAFGRYASAGVPDLVRDGVGYNALVLQLSDSEMQAMSVAVNAALLPFATNPSGEGRTARLLATIFLPADPKPAGQSERNKT
jgi:DNA-binding transcriptional ArsR family regulator